MSLSIKLDDTQLLKYTDVHLLTFKRLRAAMRRVANAGRTSARRLLNAQFRRRTGRLHAAARAMRTSTTVNPAMVAATVSRLPKLTNIFEQGATVPPRTIRAKRGQAMKIAVHGDASRFVRGTLLASGFRLAARPVKMPALKNMATVARAEVEKVLQEAGKR
jgi:hypothetical protein